MAKTRNYIAFFSSGDILSNMAPCFLFDGTYVFNCSEQLYQHRKALFYGNVQVAQEIMEARDGYAAKRIAKRLHSPEAEKQWHKTKTIIVQEIIQMKVRQNSEVRKFLCETKNAELIEANPWDNFWSGGISKADLKLGHACRG